MALLLVQEVAPKLEQLEDKKAAQEDTGQAEEEATQVWLPEPDPPHQNVEVPGPVQAAQVVAGAGGAQEVEPDEGQLEEKEAVQEATGHWLGASTHFCAAPPHQYPEPPAQTLHVLAQLDVERTVTPMQKVWL